MKQPHISIYIPHKDHEMIEELNIELDRIDCNLSRAVRMLLPSLLASAKKIKKDKNYRHYDWKITVKLRPLPRCKTVE